MTLHNHGRYTAGRLQLLHQGHESVFIGGRLAALLPPPALWWQGFLPLRTHAPLSEGRKSFVPAGRSRNYLINSNVYQNIHCVGEGAKLHAPHEAAQKTGTKDLQDEQDVCRHRRQDGSGASCRTVAALLKMSSECEVCLCHRPTATQAPGPLR